jgi:hypothetical protein
MNSIANTALGLTSPKAITIAIFLVLLVPISSNAQQTTGQLLMSSGFDPIAATTPEATARLMSFPAKQFLLRQKQGRPYYFYADPSGCGCAYVGSVAAMNKYRASFGALPSDALPSGGVSNLEQNMINSMDNNDAGAQFDQDVFGPDP